MTQRQQRDIPRNPQGETGILMRRDFDGFQLAGGSLIEQNLVTPLIVVTGYSDSDITMEEPQRYMLLRTELTGGTLTLPSAADYKDITVYIKRLLGTFATTIVTDDGATIDGASSFVLRGLDACLGVVSDGANWHIVSFNMIGYDSEKSYENIVTANLTAFPSETLRTVVRITGSVFNPTYLQFVSPEHLYGVPITVIKGGGFPVRVEAYNADIDGADWYQMNTQDDVVTFISDGTNLFVVDEVVH